VKIGLQIPDYTWPGGPGRLGATLAEIARAADEHGFDAIAVADHVWQHPYLGGPERAMLECYATLAFIAANTRRARLISVVTPIHFRYPGMLAKTVTTLDVLSGGRAWLGIGAGYYEEEARGLGIPFPPTEARFEQLEETLQICLQMWRGDERPFEGAHYRLERPLNSPQSLARPHPPIMIGGGGERKTLRLVARYADACNLYPTPELPHKLRVLRQHCEAEGRDYDAIEKTCMLRPLDVGEDGAKAGEAIEQLRQLAALGVQTAIGPVKDVDRVTPLEVLGREVIPAVADL
jgi:F420-dependent oxidoreductase-like protein